MQLLTLFIGIATPAALIVGMITLWRRRRQPPRGSFLEAMGWIGFWALPLALLAFAVGVPWLLVLLTGPLSLCIYAGGGTTVALFEATVGDLYGGRQSTFSHGEYFFALAWVQWAILATVIVVLRRRGLAWRHPALLTIGLLVLVNAVAGAHFKWWTT